MDRQEKRAAKLEIMLCSIYLVTFVCFFYV